MVFSNVFIFYQRIHFTNQNIAFLLYIITCNAKNTFYKSKHFISLVYYITMLQSKLISAFIIPKVSRNLAVVMQVAEVEFFLNMSSSLVLSTKWLGTAFKPGVSCVS